MMGRKTSQDLETLARVARKSPTTGKYMVVLIIKPGIDCGHGHKINRDKTTRATAAGVSSPLCIAQQVIYHRLLLFFFFVLFASNHILNTINDCREHKK